MLSKTYYYLARVLVALVAIPFHEAAHAWASLKLGDPTAKNAGRLSLNPMVHFDLFGTLCMVLTGVGWAKPVPTDSRRFRNPKWGLALTALAGPVANLVLAYLGMIFWKIMYYWSPVNTFSLFVARFFQMLVYMDVSLAVFNLLPIPPLDGSRLLMAFLPRELCRFFAKYERYIVFGVLALVWLGVFDAPLSWLTGKMWLVMDNGTIYIDRLANSIYYARMGMGV